MKINKIFISGLLVLSLLMSCSVCPAQKNTDLVPISIVGKWVSIKRSKGGLGGAYIFGKDESMAVLYGAIIDYKYKITGKKIFETYPNETQTTSYFSINGKTLTLEKIDSQDSTSECKLEMKRLGNNADHPKSVIGKWTYKHKTGAWTVQEYTADGKAQLCVPLVTEVGKYHLINNELLIELKGKEKISREIRIDGNRLVFLSGDGHSEEIYKKFN